jgi:hypothetical protein
VKDHREVDITNSLQFDGRQDQDTNPCFVVLQGFQLRFLTFQCGLFVFAFVSRSRATRFFDRELSFAMVDEDDTGWVPIEEALGTMCP